MTVLETVPIGGAPVVDTPVHDPTRETNFIGKVVATVLVRVKNPLLYLRLDKGLGQVEREREGNWPGFDEGPSPPFQRFAGGSPMFPFGSRQGSCPNDDINEEDTFCLVLRKTAGEKGDHFMRCNVCVRRLGGGGGLGRA